MRQGGRGLGALPPGPSRVTMLVFSAMAVAGMVALLTLIGGAAGVAAGRLEALLGWDPSSGESTTVAAPGSGRAAELHELSETPGPAERSEDASDPSWRALPFLWPVEGEMTSYFREAGPYWVGGYHQGIDLACAYGTPIKAASTGIVVMADDGWYKGYGTHVLVDHGGGVQTFYAHLSAVRVELGQKVERGQVIGLAGDTGAAVGPHLHFEVRIGGELADPLLYLPQAPEGDLQAPLP